MFIYFCRQKNAYYEKKGSYCVAQSDKWISLKVPKCKISICSEIAEVNYYTTNCANQSYRSTGVDIY